MATFAFSGGVAGTNGYGQRAKLRFGNTWAADDTWADVFASTLSGNFTVGKGQISNKNFVSGLKLRNRVYVGFDDNFALCANGDPIGWEEQNAGSAVIAYTSQYGRQDAVQGFATMQGRIAVFGKHTVQIWQIDADPANFVLQQTLANTGAVGNQSIQSIGDLDVFYLDQSGIRSLRAKESTLNAYINDVGTAIDLLIRADLTQVAGSTSCAVVEPNTRQYWLYLNGKIYVLSYYQQSKILAWSTFIPTYEEDVTPLNANYNGQGVVQYSTTIGQRYYWTKGAGEENLYNIALTTVILDASGIFTATETSVKVLGVPSAAVTGTLTQLDKSFTPSKFVVHNGQVYVLSGTDNRILRYGGASNNTYDRCVTTVELPWLDLGKPGTKKQLLGIAAAFSGEWRVQTSMNPTASAFTTVIDRGSASSPSIIDDSTYDKGFYPANGYGSHVKIKMLTDRNPTAAKFGKITVFYKPSNKG